MCLFATIKPSLNSTSPHGPTNLIGEEPATSPDSRTQIGAPKVLQSVAETSTWEAGLNGPRMETLASVFLGPTTSYLLVETYWPG